jgi:hypothetical protein
MKKDLNINSLLMCYALCPVCQILRPYLRSYEIQNGARCAYEKDENGTRCKRDVGFPAPCEACDDTTQNFPYRRRERYTNRSCSIQ